MIDDRERRGDGELTTADLAEREPAPEAPRAEAADRQQQQQQQQQSEPRAAEPAATPEAGEPASEREALFPGDEAEGMRSRWSDIQAGFVDEPRRAVEQADSLVAAAIKRLAETFAEERSRLEQQWDQGDNVETEDLRQALRRYRSFFDRILSM